MPKGARTSERQRDDESRTAWASILHPCATSMQIDELARDGEANAASGHRLRVALEPMVRLPDSLTLFGGNSRALVDDLDEQSISGRACAHRDRLASGPIFHRVVEQIEQD